MGTPLSPGWVQGFVPTAAQWNAEFASKVDYPASVDQGGTGATTAPAASYNITQRALIANTPVNLAPLTSYGVRTSVGAFSLYLPLLASLLPGDWIDLADIDFNANINNITVFGNTSDQIVLFATSAGSQVLNVAGVQARLVVNAGIWRMLV